LGGDGNDSLADCMGHNQFDAGPGQDACNFTAGDTPANCEVASICQ
jgi:hypothetical protein